MIFYYVEPEKENAMKAKDYVERFRAEGSTVQALAAVIGDMFVEVRDIGKLRHVSTDAGLLSILDEMDQKFQAFFHLTGGALSDGSSMRKDAFGRMLLLKMPDIFYAWNRQKGCRLLAS